jgi:hypothetical protein
MTWLEMELSSIRQQLEATPATAGEAARKMRRRQRDPELTAVRDPKPLDLLPRRERRGWERLWADATALEKDARVRDEMP